MNSNTINFSLSDLHVRKAWQIKEPEDKSDPIDHESFSMINISSKALMLGASIRGKRHAHAGKYREDAYAHDCEGYFRIMAVADGAGSCPFSRVGARIAVSKTIETLKLKLKIDPELSPGKIKSKDIVSYLKEAYIQAIDAIRKEAAKRQIKIKQLATTLLLTIAWPEEQKQNLAVLQVGDGLVVHSGFDGSVSILGHLDKGNYISQSKFITSQGIQDDLDSRIETYSVTGPGFLALMTDGISDDFYPPIRQLENAAAKMRQILIHRGSALGKIKEWIKYEKKGSYDDRTLILYSFV